MKDENSTMVFAIIPCIRGITEPFKRIMLHVRSFNVKVAQRPYIDIEAYFNKTQGSYCEGTEKRNNSFHSVQWLLSGVHRPDKTSVWNTFKRTPKDFFLLKKRKFRFIGACVANQPHDCVGRFQKCRHQHAKLQNK